MPQHYFGKYTGIVKDNTDAEKLGQLKVSVPAIFPPDENVVAKAALPYGYFFVPENEAKVWIEFEGGDPGLCLWTGVRYVAGEWPSEAEASPPQYRTIKTAAGHLLRFDDKSGEESVQLKDGANAHALVFDANGATLTAKSGTTLTVKLDSGGSIVIDPSSGITIDAGMMAVTVKGGGVTVDGGALPVTVKGLQVMLSSSAAMPVLRIGDSGIGNLGAPVPLIGPGNPTVLA